MLMKIKKLLGLKSYNSSSAVKSCYRNLGRSDSFKLETLEPRCLLSADAMNVVLVTSSGSDDPLYQHLLDNYHNISTLETGQFTSLNSSSSEQTKIENADLIIISPDTNDAGYDGTDDEVNAWNALNTPIVILNNGFMRNSRWHYVNSGDLDPINDSTETQIIDVNHPVFDGVNIQNGLADLFIDGAITGDFWVDVEISDIPGGQVLGTATNTNGDNLIGIVHMPANAVLGTPASTGNLTTISGERFVYGIRSLDTLTADGFKLLDNVMTSNGLQNFESIDAIGDTYTVFNEVPWSESAHTGVLSNDNIFVIDPLSTNTVLNTSPSYGTVELFADGSFNYTTNDTFVGQDSFTYQVVNGDVVSEIQTVTLNVIDNPDEFTVTIKEVTTGAPLSITPLTIGAELQIDEYDDDYPILSVYQYSPELEGSIIVQTANDDIYYHGEVSYEGTDVSKYLRLHLNQNAAIFVSYDHQFAHLPAWLGPDLGWKVVDTSYDNGQVFTKSFNAGDVWLGANDKASGGFIDRTYNIVVQPLGDDAINNAPYAYHNYYDIAGEPTLNVSAGEGVLVNDTDGEDDTLTAILSKAPNFGEINLNPDGSFTYTPGPDFTRYDYFEYMVNDGQVNGNTTIVHILNGQEQDAHHHNPHGDQDELRQSEHSAVFKLAPHHSATHIAITSGNWSDPGIWRNGILPVDYSNVLIPEGTTVTVDTLIQQSPRTVRVDGTLRFSPDVNTQLRVDTVLVNTMGVFEMGTEVTPIAQGITANLLFADFGEIDRVWDPHALSRGLISHGHATITGQDATSFLEVDVNPKVGDTQIILSAIPVNWQIGDTIVLAGVSPTSTSDNEELTILGIDGNVITVDPLSYDHLPPYEHLRVHVAHLNRNAIVSSESIEPMNRGHVMFMHSNNVQIRNAGFYDLGRTRKADFIDDNVILGDDTLVEQTGTNTRARYSLHFHRAGGDSSPAIVSGSVVSGGIGWGFVNHSSHANFTDNVAYDINGAGFIAEAGDEIGTYAFNIAIGITGTGSSISGRGVEDFGVQGDGFWMQSPGVRLHDNVAAGVRRQGFVIWNEGLKQPGSGRMRFPSAYLPDPSVTTSETVNTESVPIGLFLDNTTYGAYKGLHTQFHFLVGSLPGRTTFENFTAWNVGNGMAQPYTRRFDVINAQLLNDINQPYGDGFEVNDVTNDGHFYNLTMIGFDDGFDIPRRGSNEIHDSTFQNRVNIRAHKTRESSSGRSLLVEGTDFRTLTGDLNFEYHLLMGQPLYANRHGFNHVFYSEGIFFEGPDGSMAQVWHPEQTADYIPFPELKDELPPEYVGLTNQELMNQFGIAVGGEIAPADAHEVPGIYGLVTDLPYFLVDGPVGQDDNYNVQEDSNITTLNVLSNDSDPNSDNLVIAQFTAPQNGHVINNGTSLNYQPDADYYGIDTFTYMVTDGNGGVDIRTVTVEVNSINDLPIVPDIELNVYEDSVLTSNLISFVQDIDDNYLTINHTSPPEHGTVQIIDDQMIRYEPDPDFHGTETLMYFVNDGHGVLVPAVVTIHVLPVNDKPIALNDNYYITTNQELHVGTTTESILLERGSSWSYLDDGSDQGTAWIDPTYDDSTWNTGLAKLGYGEGDEVTTVSYIDTDPEMSGTQRNFTTYFRTQFNVTENLQLIDELTLLLRRDDGAAVYLNGVEIVRDELPEGAAFNTPASSTATGTEETRFYEHSIDLSTLPYGTLKMGINTLAVEIHQVLPSSPDISFDLELIAKLNHHGSLLNNDIDVDFDVLTSEIVNQPANGIVNLNPDGTFDYTPNNNFTGTDNFTYHIYDNGATELLSSGHLWSYLDANQLPDQGWQQPGFDDNLWPKGMSQLGYGDGDEVTRINYVDVDPETSGTQKNATSYFRTTMDISNKAQYRRFQINLIRDDAAAVYLNGVEIYRDSSLPADADHTTYATQTVSGENTFITINIDSALLNEGENTIAAEVHQASGSSSDVSFDLKLTASLYSNEATVTIDVNDAAPGDFNRDGNINTLDVDMLQQAIVQQSNESMYDLNHSGGSPDLIDFELLFSDILSSSPADITLDQQVNVIDLARLASNYGKSNNVLWSDGDINADGIVGIADLSRLANQYGSIFGGAAAASTDTGSNALMISPDIGDENESDNFAWSHIGSLLDDNSYIELI